MKWRGAVLQFCIDLGALLDQECHRFGAVALGGAVQCGVPVDVLVQNVGAVPQQTPGGAGFSVGGGMKQGRA